MSNPAKSKSEEEGVEMKNGNELNNSNRRYSCKAETGEYPCVEEDDMHELRLETNVDNKVADEDKGVNDDNIDGYSNTVKGTM